MSEVSVVSKPRRRQRLTAAVGTSGLAGVLINAGDNMFQSLIVQHYTLFRRNFEANEAKSVEMRRVVC